MKYLIAIVLLSLLLSSCTTHGSRDSHFVALTFDDGPGEYTSDFLDLLKEKNVTATFFVQGYRAQAQPLVIERMIASGHQLGFHTWNHKISFFASKDDFAREFSNTQELIPIKLDLFRPAHGIPSPASLSFAKELNISVIWWEVNSYDYEADSAQEIVDNTLPHVQPGSIVLFHDGINQSVQTLEALPRIIDQLREQGYEFTTVGELIAS